MRRAPLRKTRIHLRLRQACAACKSDCRCKNYSKNANAFWSDAQRPIGHDCPSLLLLRRGEAYTGQRIQTSIRLLLWTIWEVNQSGFALVLVFGPPKERNLFPTGELRAMKRMHSQKPLRDPGAWQAYR